MTTTTDPKIEQAAEILRQAVADKAPALPQMSVVADILATEAEVSITTARKRLRQAIEQSDGTLHELCLTVSSFRAYEVVLPNAPVRVGRTWIGNRSEDIVFTQAQGTHVYGAGKTSWLITSDRIQEICAERLAVLDAERTQRQADSQAHQKATRTELQRRDPELLTLLDRMDDLFRVEDDGSEAEYRFHAPARAGGETTPMEGRRLIVGVTARSPETVAALKKVLTAGLAAVQAEELAAENVDDGINCLTMGAPAAEFDAGTALLVGEQVTAYSASVYTAALLDGADAISQLPEDFECDPGRGDSVKLLHHMAALLSGGMPQAPELTPEEYVALRKTLAAGPEDSNVFCESDGDGVRPLGKDVEVTFKAGEEAYTVALSDGALRVDATRDMLIDPQQSYALLLRLNGS